MAMRRERRDALAVVREALAATCACDERDFLSQAVIVTPAEERPGRMRFPMASKPLLVVTMGVGVVLSCHPERVDWLRAHVVHHGRDSIFSARTIGALARYVERDGQELCGPVLKHVCAAADLRSFLAPDGVDITIFESDRVPELYQHQGFGEALSYRSDSPRPDVLAAVARRGADIVGIAAASADCDALWQVGIEVTPAERGAGLGRALVRRLTGEIRRRGRVPYYSTSVSNIASRALAQAVGYWPAWTELYARDLAPLSP